MSIKKIYELGCDACDKGERFLCEPPYAGWFEYEDDKFVCKACAKRLVGAAIGPKPERVLPMSTHQLYCENVPPCSESLRVAVVGDNPMEDLMNPRRRVAIAEQLSEFGWVVTPEGRALCKEHK